MADVSRHTYQVLSKRADRMGGLMLSNELREFASLPHIWWGTSVENRRHGLPRIAHLQRILAKVRFLSVEPLLEDLGALDLQGIHWVIAGGESGPKARPMAENWVRSIRDQCQALPRPLLLSSGAAGTKRLPGRVLDGRTWDEMPELVQVGLERLA